MSDLDPSTVQAKLDQAAQGAHSAVDAAVAKTNEAASAFNATKDDASGVIARFKKDDGSIDVVKLIKEIVAPVAVVGTFIVVGVAVKNAAEDGEDAVRGGGADGPVSSALSVFKTRTEDAVDKAGKEVDKAGKKVGKEVVEVAEESKNAIESFGDWLTGLFGGKK